MCHRKLVCIRIMVEQLRIFIQDYVSVKNKCILTFSAL